MSTNGSGAYQILQVADAAHRSPAVEDLIDRACM
jgi:hypothetical protein